MIIDYGLFTLPWDILGETKHDFQTDTFLAVS